MFRKKAVAVALLMVLAAPNLAAAAVEQVSVRIDGLACPFCAYNIEKRVKTLDGVRRNLAAITGAVVEADIGSLTKAFVEVDKNLTDVNGNLERIEDRLTQTLEEKRDG